MSFSQPHLDHRSPHRRHGRAVPAADEFGPPHHDAMELADESESDSARASGAVPAWASDPNDERTPGSLPTLDEIVAGEHADPRQDLPSQPLPVLSHVGGSSEAADVEFDELPDPSDMNEEMEAQADRLTEQGDPPAGPAQVVVPGTGTITLDSWHLAGYSWRFARHLTAPRINWLLRFGTERVLPGMARARFAAMGFPPQEISRTLGQVRSLDDWSDAWTGAAQRFLGETRRGGKQLTPAEAALARQRAALCYHIAPFFALGDDRLIRAARSSSITLFGQSLNQLMPDTRRVSVRWRSKSLPGYLSVPEHVTGRRPLVVLLNGASTAKEEMILWRGSFLAQGLAVLALDWPGTGEATSLGTVSPDNDDITDGLIELAEEDPRLDPEQIALAGISLGGSMAMRAAAQDRRIAACVAVTPPFQPELWLGAANPLVVAQLAQLAGGYEQLADLALRLNVPETVDALRCPLLVLGAGRDLVVPPAEASRLAAYAGDLATLAWYPNGGHGLFDHYPGWSDDAARWLAVVLDVADVPSPVVDNTLAASVALPAMEPELVEPASTTPAASPNFGARSTSESPGPDPVDRGEHQDAPQPTPLVQQIPDRDQQYSATGMPMTPVRGHQPPPPVEGGFGPLGPASSRILNDEPPLHNDADVTGQFGYLADRAERMADELNRRDDPQTRSRRYGVTSTPAAPEPPAILPPDGDTGVIDPDAAEDAGNVAESISFVPTGFAYDPGSDDDQDRVADDMSYAAHDDEDVTPSPQQSPAPFRPTRGDTSS